jgi:hypothetical protein
LNLLPFCRRVRAGAFLRANVRSVFLCTNNDLPARLFALLTYFASEERPQRTTWYARPIAARALTDMKLGRFAEKLWKAKILRRKRFGLTPAVTTIPRTRESVKKALFSTLYCIRFAVFAPVFAYPAGPRTSAIGFGLAIRGGVPHKQISKHLVLKNTQTNFKTLRIQKFKPEHPHT